MSKRVFLIRVVQMAIIPFALISCSSGNSSNSANSNLQNPLQEYISKLQYSPLSKSVNKGLTSTIGNQQTFTIRRTVTLSNIEISYFNNANCTSLQNMVTLNGPATLPDGSYTSTDQSNFALCSRYPGNGCQDLFAAALQAQNGWSMQYTYNFSDGTSYQGVCMNNPTNAIGNSAEVEANYSVSDTPVACSPGSSCGFSKPYADLVLGWATESGVSGGSVTGMSVSFNDGDGVYVTGNTDKALSSDSTQAGGLDYFITKYDINTHLRLWVHQVGATGGTTSGRGIATDSSGNSYITGYTDVGISGQNLQGNMDYFIAKYNINGDLLWTREVGASGGYTEGNGISASVDGNVYVVGDTSVGISGQTLQGSKDYFIAKYNADGDLLWTREVGAAPDGETIASGVSVDTTSDRNIYIAGKTNKAISNQTQFGNEDLFIAKYSSSGELLNTIQDGDGNRDTRAIGITSNENCFCVFITGTTGGSLYGNLNGYNDYFIAKYNFALSLEWGQQVGAFEGQSIGNGVSSDDSGNPSITGFTTVGLSGQIQVGNEDTFIAKYDGNTGTIQSANQFGANNGAASGNGIASTPAGDNYIIGSTTTAGIMGQSLIGDPDYFLVFYPNQN